MNTSELYHEEKVGYSVIKICKYLNADCGEELSKMSEELFKKGIKKIVLDFTNTELINSIGISVIIEIIDNLRKLKGRLFFIHLSPFIDKTLSVMGIFNFSTKLSEIDEIEDYK